MINAFVLVPPHSFNFILAGRLQARPKFFALLSVCSGVRKTADDLNKVEQTIPYGNNVHISLLLTKEE